MMTFSDSVKLELNEMKKVGLKVPDKAFELASNEVQMKEYDNMKVSECARLLIVLAQL